MIYIRKEGQKVKQGFNIYPISDESSFGGILRIYKIQLYTRYSKTLKKWFISLDKII